MKKNLVIIGDSAFAEIAYEYFSFDSEYCVVGFSVERDFINKRSLFGLPIVPMEELEQHFPPEHNAVFVAIVYTELNRVRARLVRSARERGYELASYISSRAFVWKNATIGEHCFIFEDNTIQPFVTIEDNVILWSGNHIGHHSTVRKNCFISSHVVVSGFCDIGENSFLGVNATVSNNVSIAIDNWVGPNAVIMKNTQPMTLYKTEPSVATKVSTHQFFKIKG
ncbi:acetyltransferase [Aeromonas schubertii]|uniref:acetyltransferase n=1 Tax=Aeromonas schubertii TaxID=652 RepID=UPI001CC51EF1|nr:acetyltransferase [Aeromonas schubertii]MBZ6071654.1 acetyltransferase [Aeromonas schubertii]